MSDLLAVFGLVFLLAGVAGMGLRHSTGLTDTVSAISLLIGGLLVGVPLLHALAA